MASAVEPGLHLATDLAKPRRPRPRHALHPAEGAMRLDGIDEGSQEAWRLEGIEPALRPGADDVEPITLAVDARLDPPDEPVAEQDGQDVVAPASLRAGDVDLPDVVEAEAGTQEVAVPGERVERREERHAGWPAPGQLAGGDLPPGLLQERRLRGDHMSQAPDAIDLGRQQL